MPIKYSVVQHLPNGTQPPGENGQPVKESQGHAATEAMYSSKCPICQSPAFPVPATYGILQCPNHGTKPWE